MPCSIWMPPWASGPVLTVRRPILKGAPCACTAGIFSVATLAPVASMPFNTVLRLTAMAVLSLRWLFSPRGLLREPDQVS